MSDLTASLESICARVVGAAWDDAPPIQKAHMREGVLKVLNAAVAEGWRMPLLRPRPGVVAERGTVDPTELDWTGVYAEEDL